MKDCGCAYILVVYVLADLSTLSASEWLPKRDPTHPGTLAFEYGIIPGPALDPRSGDGSGLWANPTRGGTTRADCTLYRFPPSAESYVLLTR